MSQSPTSTSAGSFRVRLCDSLIPRRALPGPAKPNKPADGQPGRTEQKDVAENFFRKRDDVLEPSQAITRRKGIRPESHAVYQHTQSTPERTGQTRQPAFTAKANQSENSKLHSRSYEQDGLVRDVWLIRSKDWRRIAPGEGKRDRLAQCRHPQNHPGGDQERLHKSIFHAHI